MMTDKMTIISICGIFMKNMVVSNVDITPIVTVDRRIRGLRGTHISEEPSKA